MQILTIFILATVWLASTLAFPFQDMADGSHRRYNLALERRTNQPPERKLSLEEYQDRLVRAGEEIAEARKQDPAFWDRVSRTLGIKGLTGAIPVSPAEMNNALRQAGYTGTPYPEARELEDYTEEEMEEYYKQEAVARRVIVQAAIQDPGFLRRLREALGLDPEGPWPNIISLRKLNKALRDVGWTGPFIPVDPRNLRPDQGRDSDEGSSSPGSGGPQTPGGLNMFSLNNVHPQSGFLSTASQSLHGTLSKKLSDFIRKIPHPAGSLTQPPPILPIAHPLGPLRLI